MRAKKPVKSPNTIDPMDNTLRINPKQQFLTLSDIKRLCILATASVVIDEDVSLPLFSGRAFRNMFTLFNKNSTEIVKVSSDYTL